MRIIEFHESGAELVSRFRSLDVSSTAVARGEGATQAYFLSFAPGGEIGLHIAMYCQILVAVGGSGWAAGADGRRVPIAPGQAAFFFERGEPHAKGSGPGMLALMVQCSELALAT